MKNTLRSAKIIQYVYEKSGPRYPVAIDVVTLIEESGEYGVWTRRSMGSCVSPMGRHSTGSANALLALEEYLSCLKRMEGLARQESEIRSERCRAYNWNSRGSVEVLNH